MQHRWNPSVGDVSIHDVLIFSYVVMLNSIVGVHGVNDIGALHAWHRLPTWPIRLNYHRHDNLKSHDCHSNGTMACLKGFCPMIFPICMREKESINDPVPLNNQLWVLLNSPPCDDPPPTSTAFRGFPAYILFGQPPKLPKQKCHFICDFLLMPFYCC